MSRTRTEQIIFVLLLIAFAGLWMMTRKTGPATVPKELLKKQQVTLETVEAAPPPPAATQELTLSRDPFQPPRLLLETLRQQELARTQKKPEGWTPGADAGPKVQLPPIELQGILWGTSRPQAIINRRILSVGDSIDGVTLLAVGPEGITVSFQEREFGMTMPQKSGQKGR